MNCKFLKSKTFSINLTTFNTGLLEMACIFNATKYSCFVSLINSGPNIKIIKPWLTSFWCTKVKRTKRKTPTAPGGWAELGCTASSQPCIPGWAQRKELGPVEPQHCRCRGPGVGLAQLFFCFHVVISALTVLFIAGLLFVYPSKCRNRM